MTPALIGTLLGILEKYGPVAYEYAIKLFHGEKEPTKGDYLAVSAGALQGSYDQDYAAARDRAERAAGGQ